MKISLLTFSNMFCAAWQPEASEWINEVLQNTEPIRVSRYDALRYGREFKDFEVSAAEAFKLLSDGDGLAKSHLEYQMRYIPVLLTDDLLATHPTATKEWPVTKVEVWHTRMSQGISRYAPVRSHEPNVNWKIGTPMIRPRSGISILHQVSVVHADYWNPRAEGYKTHWYIPHTGEEMYQSERGPVPQEYMPVNCTREQLAGLLRVVETALV